MEKTFKRGSHVGLQTAWDLGKIIFPITFIVSILKYTPVIPWVVGVCEPIMKWVGLPGEAAIPFVLANFLSLYAGIGAVLSLDLTVKEVFILAIMISFSHNLFIESAVAIKVGIRLSVVLLVRLGLAIVAAYVIHIFWQGGEQAARYGLMSSVDSAISGWPSLLMHAFQTAFIGVFQLVIIIFPLMIFIQWMKDSHALAMFSHWMKPFTKLLALSANTSTALGAGLLFGLAFGAGVIIQQYKEEVIAKKDMTLLFIFLVACHAIIEDTIIFIPLGISVITLFLIRFIVAVLLTMLVSFMWHD